MSTNEAIAFAFALTNALRLVSYAPQIWRVAHDRSGAQAISCLTWNLWIAANATTALYAWAHLHDLLLTLVNVANAACCASVVLITLAKRTAHGRVAAAPTLPLPLEIAMTTKPCCRIVESSLHRVGAGVLAASIAAAAIVGGLTLAQSAPASAPTDAVGATPHDVAEPLDAGVDLSRVEPAPEPDGASVAAYDK